MIESDETFVGGKKKNVHKGKPEPASMPCMRWWSAAADARQARCRCDRQDAQEEPQRAGGPQVGAAHRRQPCEPSVGKDFAEHQHRRSHPGRVRHKDGLAHTQTVESFFAILKRGVFGSELLPVR